mgnify:CR=1 FL=1
MRIISKLGDWGEVFLNHFGSIVIYLACLLGLEEIVIRYIFHFTHDWGEEVFMTASLFAIFMLMGLASRYDEHIKIDFLIRTRTGMFKKILVWFTDWAGLLVSIALVVMSLLMVMAAYRANIHTYSSLALSVWAIKLSFPIGTVFLAFYYLERVCRLFTHADKGATSAEEE